MSLLNRILNRMGYVPRSSLAQAQALLEEAVTDLDAAQQKNLELSHELEALQAEVFIDEKTQILNLKGLKNAFHKAKETLGPDGASFILVDANNLKEINAELGLDGGDSYLRHVADGLEHISRGRGVAGRIGGDEFAIVCHSPEGEAERLADDLRDYIAENPAIHLENGQEYRVQGSVATGVVGLSGEKDYPQILDEASVILKENKREMKERMASTGHAPYNIQEVETLSVDISR